MAIPLRSLNDDAKPDYRQPPANLEAEMGLLGAILENNGAYERVSEFLRAEHFADAAHGRIFDACSRLIERGQLANPTTLRHVFETVEFERMGGHRYLAELAAATLTVINAEDYGMLIYDLHLRRELIELGTDVVNEAYSHDPDDSAMRQIETAEQGLYNLATHGSYEGGFRSFADSLTSAINTAAAASKRDGAYGGLPTRFWKLDQMLGGLHKSDLVVLAGRPSMGKTALATNIAFNIATANDSFVDERGVETPVDNPVVGFFSLEMSAEQLAARILAENAQISSDRIRKGELNQTEFNRLVEASQRLQKAPIYIDDTPALTISALRTRARRLKRQQDLGLIIVDYLQLVQAPIRDPSRVQEVAEITRGLKALAKELDIPVLALSQLSRAVEQREDKRPLLADLRESGTIEQDADVVMFIFRQEYYLQRMEPIQKPSETQESFNRKKAWWDSEMEKESKRAEIIIAKQRHGPTGTVPLRFHAEATKFDNLEDEGYGGERRNDNAYGDAPF